MKIIETLYVDHGGQRKIIYFGSPDSEMELDEMYALRFNVYSRNGYFDTNKKHHTQKDIDDYDHYGKCHYVIAVIDGRIIGAVRLIQTSPLPTEVFFDFTPPKIINEIEPAHRAEISRLVIDQYSKDSFLPRNLILLFLIKILLVKGNDLGIVGGYAFIKKNLFEKLNRLKVPVMSIKLHVQRYPSDGVLYNYFNQDQNPVSPSFFISSEVEAYIEGVLGVNSHLVSQQSSGHYILNNTLYTKFLRRLKIL